jgi:hypothetical protein
MRLPLWIMGPVFGNTRHRIHECRTPQIESGRLHSAAFCGVVILQLKLVHIVRPVAELFIPISTVNLPSRARLNLEDVTPGKSRHFVASALLLFLCNGE